MAEVIDLKPTGPENPPPPVGISVAEAVKLGAVDTEFYGKTFFPRAFRHTSPSFASEIWSPLEDPKARFVNIIAARGSSKTTRLRTFASKRIAYGISKTILIIGASERDAIFSVQWLRGQMERNALWRGAFNLAPGRKWEETQIQIEHKNFGHTIWVLGAGINGSLRGINFDDYRPDLILMDDPQTDEMASSLEQREKVEDLILGAVQNSLAPVADEPNAKLAMLITPQHKDDVSQKALKDTQWVSRVIPCWTKETLDKSVDQQVSAWPERYPTEELREEKRNATRRGKLSIFAREKECRLISNETAEFKAPLIIRSGTKPIGCYAVLGIDPVPPPSDQARAKGFVANDYEAQYVWGRHNGEYHLLGWERSRGHAPTWSVNTALRLAWQFKVARVVVEVVAYQSTLKWLLEETMKRRGMFFPVMPANPGMAKMKKVARISTVIGGLTSARLLHVGPEDTHFIDQYNDFSPTYAGIDDDLDASAMALADLSNPFLEADASGRLMQDDMVEELDYVGRAP